MKDVWVVEYRDETKDEGNDSWNKTSVRPTWKERRFIYIRERSMTRIPSVRSRHISMGKCSSKCTRSEFRKRCE